MQILDDHELGKLEVWPGYKASSCIYNSGIFLVLESITKFVRKESCLEKINELMRAVLG